MSVLLDFKTATLEQLIAPGGHECACGRKHEAGLEFARVGSGAVVCLREALALVKAKRPFVVCDPNTRRAAMPAVREALGDLPCTEYTFQKGRLEPDETAMGELCMAYDTACDFILAVGSGVVNDCCRMLARALSLKSGVVATAPSMDGYASNSSAMVIGGLKVTVIYRCPAFIIADTDIVRLAPERMLRAGLGDMLAKFNALAEWEIDHLINGEPYCPNVAGLVRAATDKVANHADGLLRRDPAAVEAVIEGLILSGMTMSFMGRSRPASGVEHYFSHVWEMRALDRGEESALHGEQVGVGLLLACRLRDQLLCVTPSRRVHDAAMDAFSDAQWAQRVRDTVGSAADMMIQAEHDRNHNNDRAASDQRFERIAARWDDVRASLADTLPSTEVIERLMRGAGMAMTPGALGLREGEDRVAYLVTRDIRKKYLLTTLIWDLGLLEDERMLSVFAPVGAH